MSIKKSRFFLLFLLASSATSWAMEDEIDFFNVGQGHAVLVNRHGQQTTGEPYVPLLIDAGSSSLPYTHQKQYLWEENQRNSFVFKIASRILGFWKASTNDILGGENYKLNIIVTHGDDDHGNLIPLILRKLEEEKITHAFSFRPLLFLGGEKRHYSKKDGRRKTGSFLDLLKQVNPNQKYEKYFSEAYQGMHLQAPQPLDFLNTSGCITHLYCPKGTATDENTWSIITRIQINGDGISAIITGDTDRVRKNKMADNLSERKAELESDILMLPHHGAKGTFSEKWDPWVNPKAIVIGAAPNGGLLERPNNNGYLHPRGETILASLSLLEGRGRIWNKVIPHAIEYYCDEASHARIEGVFDSHDNYLFERVPNGALVELDTQPDSRWHLVWTNAPIYSLWTTGSLVFKGNVTTPQFIDAPNGLMGYVALTSPEYYLSPDQRPQNIALTTLIGYLLQDGEGNPEELKNTITAFPVERIRNTEREGILLTQGLSLNANRAKILKALWEVPLEQREEILSQFKALTKYATKDHSLMYWIFEYLMRMEDRENYLNYLNENALLVADDVLRTTKALRIFSHLPLEEAQEIVELFYPDIYPNFQNISSRDYANFLGMVEALTNSIRNRRAAIFNAAMPTLMPYEFPEDQTRKFLYVEDNAKLIQLYASESEPTLPIFKQRFEEAIGCLSTDGEVSLYPENKHFFIKTFVEFPSQHRLDFLESILPIIHLTSTKGCKNFELPIISEKLAGIYSEPNYGLRLEFFRKKLSELNDEDKDFYISEVLFKDCLIKASAIFAAKRAITNK